MRSPWILLVCALVLAGCGRRNTESPIKEDRGGMVGPPAVAQVPALKPGGEGEAKKKERRTKSLPLPPNFPDDVYVYGTGVVEIAEAVEDGFSLSIRTSDTESKVLESYKSEMVRRGWECQAATTGSLLIFLKGDRVTSVACLSHDGSIMVGLTVSTM